MMNKERVIITGGAGFIGSHLAELCLKNGLEVTIIDNFSTSSRKNISELKNLKIIEADIRNLSEHEKEFDGVSYVFHLAALADIVPSIDDASIYHDVNVNGTVSLLEVLKKYPPKKLVYAASSSCYGIPKTYPTGEDELIDARYPYALTKRVAEEYVLHYEKVYGIKAVSLRLFNVYGPKSKTHGTYGAVFGTFLAQKLNSHPYTVVGDGKQRRDFVYVTDVARAFYKAANSDFSAEIFNVGTGKPQSINRLVELLGGEIAYIPKRPGEPEETNANISRIKSSLEWEPLVCFEEGVKKMLENIDYWKDAPLFTEEEIHKATKSWFKYLK